MAESIDEFHGLFLRQLLHSILQRLFQMYQHETLLLYSKKHLGPFELQCQLENILKVLKSRSPIEKNVYSLAQLKHFSLKVKAMKIAFLQSILECGLSGHEHSMAKDIQSCISLLSQEWKRFKGNMN
jgi:hypothetical protein